MDCAICGEVITPEQWRVEVARYASEGEDRHVPESGRAHVYCRGAPTPVQD